MQRQTIFLARQSGLLLVALVAHLALMASPLHTAAMYQDTGGSAEVAASMDDEASAASAPNSGGSTGCMIEWASPATSLSIQLLVGAIPCDGVRPLLGVVIAPVPLPQAHGPPGPGDVQALLQVFRI
jgi:hypothetical protein